MNWYKATKTATIDVIDFESRNIANAQIHTLSSMLDSLKYASKLVFQNARLARESTNIIINNKKISSFPVLEDILIEAYKSALDSPWRFAQLCNEAVIKLGIEIKTLEKKRKEFSRPGDKTIKGLPYAE